MRKKTRIRLKKTDNIERYINNSVNNIAEVIRWKKDAEKMFYRRASPEDASLMKLLQEKTYSETYDLDNAGDKKELNDNLEAIELLCHQYGIEVF